MTIKEYFENNEKLDFNKNPELVEILEEFIKYLEGEKDKSNQE